MRVIKINLQGYKIVFIIYRYIDILPRQYHITTEPADEAGSVSLKAGARLALFFLNRFYPVAVAFNYADKFI
jgi:hypothetical protein